MKKSLAAAVASVMLLSSMGNMPGGFVHAYDGNVFTHMEWTGKGYTDKSGKAVSAEDVFAVNRTPASVNSVPYQSIAAAVKIHLLWRFINSVTAQCHSYFPLQQ